MFCNGKTATLSLSNVGLAEENAGGTKLFDRARSAGCKNPHELTGYLSKPVGIEPFASLT